MKRSAISMILAGVALLGSARPGRAQTTTNILSQTNWTSIFEVQNLPNTSAWYCSSFGSLSTSGGALVEQVIRQLRHVSHLFHSKQQQCSHFRERRRHADGNIRFYLQWGANAGKHFGRLPVRVVQLQRRKQCAVARDERRLVQQQFPGTFRAGLCAVREDLPNVRRRPAHRHPQANKHQR
jgi:hypothetical protein